jgi:hypothetical protein
MATQKKTKKAYNKPKVTQVKLEMDEVVLQACKHFDGDSTLQACKHFDGDSTGKGNKTCGTNACKLTFGS